MKNLVILFFLTIVTVSCSEGDYIIGGDVNESNKVDKTTYEFLESFEVTKKTAKLFEQAGMIDEINGDVTIFAPSDYAIDRYLRRKNNRMLRLNPDTTLMTLEDIPESEMQKLGMYIVDNKYWRETIPESGITLPTHSPGDTLRITLEESIAEPSAAWDGGGTPGWGYQYPNFMQTTPEKVFVHFKRGNNWEMDANQRVTMGFDNPETDKVYQMYLSDVVTNTGVVHIIYVGNENYSSHYHYHTLFFFGTRNDDQL